MARKPKAPPPPLPPPPKPGRPAHVPTAKDSTTVKVMVAGGIQHEHIAGLLNISVRTLTRHYRKEIANGMAELALTVLAAHIKRIKAGDMRAIEWWEKARLGWTEKVIVDTPPGAIPMRVIVELVGDPPPAAANTDNPQRRGDMSKYVQLIG